jgi:sensor histidine kinase YesM
MQINKWRLFGLHYAFVLTVLLFWTFTVTHRYSYNGGHWIDWISIIWPSIVSTLFLEKDAPVLSALLLTLFATSFYLFIFQDLIQKKYKKFIGKFFLFIVLLSILRILLWAFYDWLLFNYTYSHTQNDKWIKIQLENGNLFRPFGALLIDSFDILTHNGLLNMMLMLRVENNTFYLLYTAFFTLIMYVWQSRKREAELEKLQRETEINSLKAQLNPHFLFNSLNTIYSSALTEKDTSTAQLVQQLSGILRHSVEEVQQEKTDLQKEMAFIEKYVALQRARLPEHPNVSIESHLFWDQEPAEIAPLLLIPFVENAFQYGVSIDEPSFVKVDLRVEDRKLHLYIKNSITTHHEEKKGAGTGLKNAEKRLALLYPDRYSLRYDSQKDTFEVHLTLEL